MLAESYLHTLSPFLLRISGEIGLRWYGLAYLAGFVVAGHIMGKLVKTGRSPLARQKIDPGSLLTSLVVGVIVGGRLGFALFYQPQVLWTFGSSFRFGNCLPFTKGAWPATAECWEYWLLQPILFKRTNWICMTPFMWLIWLHFVQHQVSFLDASLIL